MSKRINKNIDDALFNFYLVADKDTISDLLAEDLDMALYEKKKKNLRFKLKAEANKQKYESLLKAAAQFEEAILKGVDKPIAILKQIIYRNPSLALYSKLDKLSKEDIMEIIKDGNLVDILNQLESKE